MEQAAVHVVQQDDSGIWSASRPSPRAGVSRTS